jgi:hypothetical protein
LMNIQGDGWHQWHRATKNDEKQGEIRNMSN